MLQDFAIVAGLQLGYAKRGTEDYFLRDGDDSASRPYQYASPKVGFIWDVDNHWQVYGNLSRSTEVPTLSELNPSATPGLADIDAQRATTVEIGTRGQRERFGWDLALYRTWINDEIIALYGALHREGHAHSVECRRDGALVGGLYGVSIGAAFFGESMFSRETDASKVALVHLVARLRRGGYILLDAQFMTAHLARFGAVEVPRRKYRRLLADALARTAHFPATLDEAGQAILADLVGPAGG